MAERGGRPVSLGFVARAAVILVGVWALANLLWLAVDVLFVAFFAVLVGAYLSLGVGLLGRVGVSRGVAALATLLLTLGAVVGLGALAWPTLSEELGTVGRGLPESLSRISRAVEEQARGLGVPGAEDGGLADAVREQAATLAGGAMPVVRGVVGAVSGVILVLFAGLFLVMEPRLYLEQGLRLFPPDGRERLEDALQEAAGTLRRWIGGTLVSMTVVGIATTVGLVILGVPGALALGLIAGFAEFVPTVGPWLAALPAVAIALLDSPQNALWVAGLYLVIQFLESNLLTPLVMRQAVHLPPALTLLFQTLMALVFGFLGLLLAVPILAVGVVLARRLYVEPLERGGG